MGCAVGNVLRILRQAENPRRSRFQSSPDNLVGELKPADVTDEVIINSSHLDTQLQAPGSFDDLTGVATMIEVARALASHRNAFRRALRIVTFTGEEFGFLGSKSYVLSHADELAQVKLVLNFDELTAETAKGTAVMWSPVMCELIRDVFARTSRQMSVRNFFCFSSDYVPFMLAGVPVARPADFNLTTHPKVSHTRYDTPDQVDYDWVRQNAMNFAQLLYTLLVHPDPLPVSRKTREEVAALVNQEQIESIVALCGLDDILDVDPHL